MADTHGIVYTPQEIVDFMCAAVEEVLANEFGKKLGDDGVFVIDPCTGTGSFVANLLRRAHSSNPRHFERFYKEQLFANEVMLMPYYIASLNVEHEYYELTGQYEPFEGVCFVDTLDLAEGAQMKLGFMTEANTARVERQKQAPITVIIGNPPYNVGQLNENDNNKNRTYNVIDSNISETYSRDSVASSKTKLSDAYIKFFRWAVDRLGQRQGLVCFVTNNWFINGIAFDGFRKHMLQDFDLIYHFDLRGNARTSGEKRRQEAGNVFDDQIRVGIGITVAVRTSNTEKQLFYHAVEDYLSSPEKKKYLSSFENLSSVSWKRLLPDDKFSWFVPENADEFSSFMRTGDKSTKNAKSRNVESIFKTYSLGVSTNRDDVVYDFTKSSLVYQVKQFIEDYNAEVDRYKRSPKQDVDDFVNYDKIKWSGTLKLDLGRGNYAEYATQKLRTAMYRPFCKKYLYFDHVLNERQREFPEIFPNPSTEDENLVIWVKIGPKWPFFVLLSNHILDLLPTGGSQCFPFYVYDEDGGNRRENITDWALAQFRARYGETLNPRPLLPQGEGEKETEDAVFRARASEAMTHIARDLRQRQTAAEVILWECLRGRRLDSLKFRRQHAIENTAYVVDFLCYETRLVVELDGGVHAGQVEDDAIRQSNIEAQGYRVLRIPNEAVYNDLETVLTTIITHARHTPDSASFSPRPEGEGPGVRVITKWAIFYYVYGLLHHPGYRERYADNLKRELPRIPFAPDFWAFSHAGKKLADLHLKYEDVQGYDLTWETKGQQNYRVEKMRLSKDKTTLRVNDYLTLANIPAAALQYRLGNRSALEWVIDQYQVKTDSRSGITSDPNGYSDDPRYIVDLVEKVVRVSVDTVQIVDELAGLEFRE